MTRGHRLHQSPDGSSALVSRNLCQLLWRKHQLGVLKLELTSNQLLS